jgi:hypothetical protein
MMIATIESLMGSFWFALMLAAGGYIAGNLFPLSRFKR